MEEFEAEQFRVKFGRGKILPSMRVSHAIGGVIFGVYRQNECHKRENRELEKYFEVNSLLALPCRCIKDPSGESATHGYLDFAHRNPRYSLTELQRVPSVRETFQYDLTVSIQVC